MLSGSDKLKNALADYAELADKQNEKKSGRKLSNELALQQEANKGQADVANIRNTGAMDVQKSSEGSAKELLQSKLTSEQPVQSAQARYLGAHADLYEAQAGVVGQQKGALAKQEEAKAALYGAQAENQSLTNTLAKKYGEQKVQNELSLQSAGTEKIGMELDLLKQDYDKTQNDAAMSASMRAWMAPGGGKQQQDLREILKNTETRLPATDKLLSEREKGIAAAKRKALWQTEATKYAGLAKPQ